MKKAWIENGIIREIADGNPSELFVAEIAALFTTDVPDEAEPGWFLDDGEWVAPAAPPVEPVEPPPAPAPARRRKLTPAEFRNSFSAFEEVAIVAFSTAIVEGEPVQTATIRKVVGVFFDRLRDPHLTTVDLEDPRNVDGLRILVTFGILTPERMDAITSGLPA